MYISFGTDRKISDMANSAADDSEVNKTPTKATLKKTGIIMYGECFALTHDA